jgi:hypothetical protein
MCGPGKIEFVSTGMLTIPRMVKSSGETNNEMVTTAPIT